MTPIEKEFRACVRVGDGEELRRFMLAHLEEVGRTFGHTSVEVLAAVSNWDDEELVRRCRLSLKAMQTRPAIDRCALLAQAGSDLGAACTSAEYGVEVPRRPLERLAKDAGRAILSFIDGEDEVNVEAWRVYDLLRNPRVNPGYVMLRDGALVITWATGRVRFRDTEVTAAHLHRARMWAVDNRVMNKNQESKRCEAFERTWAGKLHVRIPIVREPVRGEASPPPTPPADP
jgi:hypothetical protein